MPINFVGEFPTFERVVTGMYSFDRAFENQFKKDEIGIPVRTIWEVFGDEAIGKTTFALNVGAIVANALGGSISICPFDNVNPASVSMALEHLGYSGDVSLRLDKTHEASMDALLKDFANEKVAFGLIDTYSQVTPVGEKQGSVADAVMGKKAIAISKFLRVAHGILWSKKTPSVLIGTNHVRTPFNARFPGVIETPGGQAIKDHSQVRIRLRKNFTTAKKWEGAWILDGTVVKWNWGMQNKTFRIFMVGGIGAHIGMTNVIDAIDQGKLKVTNGVLLSGKKSYGRISKIISDNLNDADLFAELTSSLNSAEVFEKSEELFEESIEAEDTTADVASLYDS